MSETNRKLFGLKQYEKKKWKQIYFKGNFPSPPRLLVPVRLTL